MATEGPKILLVSNKANTGYNIAPPLGLYQLHGHLLRQGVQARLLDRELDGPDNDLDLAARGAFNIIGFSVSHDRMADDMELIGEFHKAVKRSNQRCIFIAGGQEATLNYEQWLGLGIDVCFLGFAEDSLAHFCLQYAKTQNASLRDLLNGIDGVAYKAEAGEIVNKALPPLHPEAFSRLFFDNIQKNDIPYIRYWERLRSNSADTSLGASKFVIENVRLYTTSHCPRRCGFCNSQSFLPESHGGPIPIVMLDASQQRELVLHMAAKYGAKGFLFSDDDFPVGNKAGLSRLKEFCEMIAADKQQGLLSPEIGFACQARIMDFIYHDESGAKQPNLEIMKCMAKAGFGSVGLGVETFCDRLLKAPSVNKIGVTGNDCKMIVNALLDCNLVPQMNLIIGIPESEPDELAHTLDTALEFLVRGCDIAVTKHLLALPGAPIYGKNLYQLASRIGRHPLTGEAVSIADHFLPNHPLILDASNRFDQESSEELSRVVRQYGWEGKIVHKRVVGLCSLIAVARLIERYDLEDKFRFVLDGIINKKATVAVRAMGGV